MARKVKGGMSYFQVKRYKKLFEEFERLTQEYWSALPEQHHDSFLGRFKYTENEESLRVRMKIAQLLPLVQRAASYLGVPYTAKSIPPAAIGGVIVPVDLFQSVIDPQQGYEIVDRKHILDTINVAKSLAAERKRKELVYMLLPWNWIIEICAFIIRIPFLILRRAGLPPKVEENIIAHAIKIVATIILISWLTYKGISLIGIDIVDLIKSFIK